MKKTILVLLFVISVCYVKAQSEFSDSKIQVGVVVSDLEKSVDFYTNVIGMKKTGGFSVNEDVAKRTGLSNGVPFDVTVLKLEDSENANQWKLMSFGKKSQHTKQEYIQDDIGMQYVTVLVKDLKPIVDRCEKYNVKLRGETPTKLGEDRFFVLVQDPDGTFIELIGPMSGM